MEAHRDHVPASLLPHRKLEDMLMRAAEWLEITHVAMIGMKTVGFIVVHDDEVEHLYVAQEAREAGIAAMLLARGEALIAAYSKVAWLSVVPGNTRARRFYERHGWNNAGQFMQPARVAEGTVLVPSLRYEKQLR
jgi:ribosomal protein S18 acetylase RimI-like enzyme